MGFFVQVTVMTGQSQVVRLVAAAMLLGKDMIDMDKERREPAFVRGGNIRNAAPPGFSPIDARRNASDRPFGCAISVSRLRDWT